MFFTLAKVLSFLLRPSSLIWLGLLGGLVMRERMPRWRRLSLAMTIGALVALFVAGLTPLSNVLILPLEDRFPVMTPQSVPTPVSGLIVLGGAEDGWVSAGRGGLALNEAAERITETARLALAHPHAKVVITGGVAKLMGEDAEGSNAVAALLRDLGIAQERLIVETRSRDTYENATLTLPLTGAKPGETWLLVTSAYHMPRAIGIFRKAGLNVHAYPVDFRLRGAEDLKRWFWTIPDGLKRFDLAVTEWAGLAAYRLSGRTSELLPAP